ncbi:uncharacterized protein A4U43_C05F7770 [Asparagus officinalis]|uniref:Uncharacterized protein n=1 Tax=Asparagus officinalis TaxID=4686 RepID=A0A5P1EUE5_ASPOF|nr:uncharacterized protein A4U43_C05F7770 [Asparagus officinalis]
MEILSRSSEENKDEYLRSEGSSQRGIFLEFRSWLFQGVLSKLKSLLPHQREVNKEENVIIESLRHSVPEVERFDEHACSSIYREEPATSIIGNSHCKSTMTMTDPYQAMHLQSIMDSINSSRHEVGHNGEKGGEDLKDK